MSLLDLGLEAYGIPEVTVQELDKQLPAFERLLALYQKAEPDIAAVLPVVKQILAIVRQKEGTS